MKLSNLEEKLYQEHTSIGEGVTKSVWGKISGALNNLQDYYFKPKAFEKSGRVYEKLGVKVYKKFLPLFGDYVSRLILHPFGYRAVGISNKSILSPKQFDIYSRGIELTHAIIGTMGLMASIFLDSFLPNMV